MNKPIISQHSVKGLKDEEQVSVEEILNDEGLRAENNYVQVSGTFSKL